MNEYHISISYWFKVIDKEILVKEAFEGSLESCLVELASITKTYDIQDVSILHTKREVKA